MKLNTIAEKIDAKILHQGRFSENEILRFYAGDKMSDLLNEASETTLIVTNLANPQLLRFAEIMDVPGICLLNSAESQGDLIKAANSHGTTIIVAPHDMSETCERLQQCLKSEGPTES
jgi:hypothetical protein